MTLINIRSMDKWGIVSSKLNCCFFPYGLASVVGKNIFMINDF